MRLLYVALKDLYQIVKDWKSALFLLAMPLAFTVFFGFVTGGNYKEPGVRIGWVDEDPPAPSGVPDLGAALRELVAAGRGVTLSEPAGAREAEALVRSGKLAAAAVLPAGFRAAAWSARPLPLRIVAREAEPSGRVAAALLRSAATRALGAAQAARLALGTGAGTQAGPAASEAGRLGRDALGLALASWREPPVRLQAETFLPAASLTGFLQSSPGMIVQFAIYGLISSAMLLVVERNSRAMQRLLTTTLPRAAIIGGHLVAMFVLTLAQEAVLVACGQLAFHVDYLRAPAATLLMVAALAAWSAGLGLLIGALARKEQHVIIYALAAMFVFSALGGAWFPLDVAGPAFAGIGRLTPGAWAIDGFQSVLLRGQGLAAVLQPAGLLAACGTAFFALALWRFRFE